MNILFLFASFFTFGLVNGFCKGKDCDAGIRLIFEELIKRNVFPSSYLPKELFVIDPLAKKPSSNDELLVVIDDNQYKDRKDKVKLLLDNAPIGYQLVDIVKDSLPVLPKNTHDDIVIVYNDDGKQTRPVEEKIKPTVLLVDDPSDKSVDNYYRNHYDSSYSSDNRPLVLELGQSDNYNAPDESAEFLMSFNNSDSDEDDSITDERVNQFPSSYNKYDSYRKPFSSYKTSNNKMLPNTQKLNRFYKPLNKDLIINYSNSYETSKKDPMKIGKPFVVEFGIQPRMGEKGVPKEMSKENEHALPKTISARMPESSTNKTEDIEQPTTIDTKTVT